MNAETETRAELRVDKTAVPLTLDLFSRELQETRELWTTFAAPVEKASTVDRTTMVVELPDFDSDDVSDAVARNPEKIRRMIAEAAYFKAEQRGFLPGHEAEDWFAAESEVMAQFEFGV